MDLYIVRHAWAGHFGDPQWPDDAQRPLTEEGKQRFARLVEKLAARDFAPSLRRQGSTCAALLSARHSRIVFRCSSGKGRTKGSRPTASPTWTRISTRPNEARHRGG